MTLDTRPGLPNRSWDSKIHTIYEHRLWGSYQNSRDEPIN